MLLRDGSRVRGFRFRDSELVLFRRAADHAGLPLNGWVRRALVEAARLEEALARQEAQGEFQHAREV